MNVTSIQILSDQPHRIHNVRAAQLVAYERFL